MKKLTLSLTILTAFCALAYAGPEPYSGKDMKQVAPVPPSCPDWNGFYVGGFAGYKFGVSDTSLELGGDWLTAFPDDLNAAGSRDTDPSGAEVGGIIGFNHQFNKWVVGVEASAAYLWVDDSNHFENVIGSGGLYDLNTSLESSYLFTFGPRIGYAFCKWLPYVTGGLAVGDIDFHQEFVTIPTPFARQGDSANQAQVGWMVGGGLEYAVTDHWRVRGQYQYVDLGSVDFDSVYTVNGVPAPAFTGHHEASLREHNVSFALIYGF
jgi:outer membrane immunogenic protein